MATITSRSSLGPIAGLPKGRPSARTIGSFLPTVAVTAIWAMAARQAWRLRSVIGEHEAVHGEVRAATGQRTGPVGQLHDDLLAVGADYFYPFGFGTMIVLALAWTASLLFVQTEVRGLRRSLAVVGLVVLALQWLILAAPLETYVLLTD